MIGFLRLLIVAAMLAMLAKAIERARRSKTDAPPPEWPSWSERQGPTASETSSTDDDATPTTTEASSSEAPVDGACPDGYPVKVKETSGIYHVAGMRNYDRTNPDRCYATADAAEADGYRASKI